MPAHMLPKPAKGTARKMQQARRRLIETKERAAKLQRMKAINELLVEGQRLGLHKKPGAAG